jgi:sulfite exporter TauE/SafE
MQEINTKEIEKEIKRTSLKRAFYRAIGVVTSTLGGVTLLIALTGDKSWDTITIGIALIAIGLSYEGISANISSDFKLNVINKKIEFLGTEFHAIHALLSVEEKLNKLREDINNVEAKIAKTKKRPSK